VFIKKSRSARTFFCNLNANIIAMTPEVITDHPVSFSLAPYTGTWTRAEAAHLLRRTLFGPTFQQIVDATSNGMNATVATLLTLPPLNPPVAYHIDEAVTAIGSTWINDVFPTGDTGPTQGARIRSLTSWLQSKMNSSEMSISVKMTMFWQNHFAASDSGDARSTYDYFELLFNNCLGDFKQLVKDITINPEMLIFLNGNTNTLYSPNENFAREFLELYTIGKGPQIGPGDYTNYTEDDIAAGARIFTGWLVNGRRSSTETDVTASFNPSYHDNTAKTLSSKFNGAVILGNTDNEYSDFIDVVFMQDECARFMCRKLYRYFVNYDLTSDVETNVIPEMVQTLLTNNYNVLPVMEELLKSEHFYDASLRGCQIKSPLEGIFTLFSSSESTPGYDLETNYEMYRSLHGVTGLLGQSVTGPPSVGGWPAYYQNPSFSQLWLNATYLKLRLDYSNWFTIYSGIQINGNFYKVKALNVVDGLSQSADAPAVIDDLCDLYFCKGLDAAERLILKGILTNQLPDFEWTIQYNDYQADPTNTAVSDPVRLRVEAVLAKIFSMAQFHTV
jgi:uncharacterized protein (DUF1800 family)